MCCFFSFQCAVHGFPHKPSALAYDRKLKLLAIGTKTGALRMYPFALNQEYLRILPVSIERAPLCVTYFCCEIWHPWKVIFRSLMLALCRCKIGIFFTQLQWNLTLWHFFMIRSCARFITAVHKIKCLLTSHVSAFANQWSCNNNI